MKSKIVKDLLLIFSVAVVQFTILFISRPAFESNDDMGIVGILSGQNGWPAYPDGIYLSKALSQVLFTLYNFEYFPWYSCLLYAIQTLSLFLVIKIIFKVVFNHYLKITSLVTLFFLYQYLFLRLNFTSTSLFLCFAASSYIFMKVLTNDKFSKREILLAILFSFSFLIRPDIYYIYILYTLPIFGFILLSKNVKRLLFVVLPIILIVISSFTYDYYFKKYIRLSIL